MSGLLCYVLGIKVPSDKFMIAAAVCDKKKSILVHKVLINSFIYRRSVAYFAFLTESVLYAYVYTSMYCAFTVDFVV